MGAFSNFGWTGASGQQIGYADTMPKDKYDAFTSDEIHGQAFDPNAPNMYALPGAIGDVPVNIQDDYELVDYGLGMGGWVLDDIPMPVFNANPGTKGHEMPISPAGWRHRPDPTHQLDVYQLAVPTGHGVDFYGQSMELNEVHAWHSSSTPAPNSKSFPAEAHEDTGNWPEPFDSLTVAPNLNVPRLTEKIGMRRIAEDDRPTYRQLAVPAQNTKPSGSVYTPTYESNVYVHNVTPLPAFGRSPVLPWTSQEIASPTDSNQYDDADVFGDMSLQ